MSLFEKINEDVKDAMKAKAKEKLDALRMLKASLLENKTAPNPKPETDVLFSHVKRLGDSLLAFPEGHAQRAKIQAEINELKVYMPKAMTEGEVHDLVKIILEKNPGSTFGAVMKLLSPEIKGKFDGSKAAELVKSLLG